MSYLEFDGNQKLPLGFAKSLNLSGRSFTISCWIYINKYNGLEINSGDNAIIGMDSVENFQTLHLLVRCKKLWFDFYCAGLGSISEISEKVWYHVACVYDKDAKTQAIFINGELDNTVGDIGPLQGNNMLFISSYAGGRSLNGRIAYLHIWSAALPVEAIRSALMIGPDNNPLQNELAAYSSQQVSLDLSKHTRMGHDDSLSIIIKHEYNRLIKSCDIRLSSELTAVLNLGRKKWGRSKIMIVGEGRAGKTAFSNTILGKEYEATQSTIGINEMTCEIKDIVATSTDAQPKSWSESKRPGKEFETALADLISRKRAQENTQAKDNYSDRIVTHVTTGTQSGHIDLVNVNKMDTSEATGISELSPEHTGEDDYILIEKECLNNGTDIEENEKHQTLSVDIIDEDYVIKALSTTTLVDSNLILSVYDFGGQSVFNVIHPFFLTRYGVYLIVFNMQWIISSNEHEKKECLAYLSHWLNSVTVYTYHKHPENGAFLTAPFAFVGTHKDIVKDPLDHENISQILYDTFGSNIAWGNLLDNIGEDGSRGKTSMCFFPIDNTICRRDNTAIRLLHAIEKAVDNESYVHEEKPLSWFRFLDELTCCKKPSLSLNEVLVMARNASITSKLTVYEMLSFFHEVGILMWHSDVLLRDVIILEPITFFVTPATTVICKHTPTAADSTYHTLPIHVKCRKLFGADFNVLTTKGIITERLLLSLLEESNEHRAQIVHLMVKYGLLVLFDGDLDRNYVEVAISACSGGDNVLQPFSGSSGTERGTMKYVVPALLPVGDIAEELKDSNNRYSHTFLFSFYAYDTGGLYHDHDHDSSASVVYGKILKERGFLPNGIFQKLIGRAIAWSQETSGNTSSYVMFRNIVILYVGNQQFRLIERLDMNVIQVDVQGGSPLAVHERLRFMLDMIITECMKSLVIQTLLPYSNTRLTEETIDESSIFVSLHAVKNVLEKSSALSLGTGGKRRIMTHKEAKELYKEMISNTGVLLQAYDVFLSYRWGVFDGDFMQKMFDRLTMYTVSSDADRPINTFLDTKRLKLGRPYQKDFLNALSQSSVVVPLVSYNALQRMLKHDPSKEDNVLVEWLSAQICASRPERCRVKFILPVFYGRPNNTASSTFSIDNLLTDGTLDCLPDIIPSATIVTATNLLRGIHILDEGDEIDGSLWTVKNIVFGLKKYLLLNATDLCGSRSSEVLSKCVNRIYDIILALPMENEQAEEGCDALEIMPWATVSVMEKSGVELQPCYMTTSSAAVVVHGVYDDDRDYNHPPALQTGTDNNNFNNNNNNNSNRSTVGIVEAATIPQSEGHVFPARLSDYTVADVTALICSELVIPVSAQDIARLKLTGDKLVEVEQVSDFADLGLLLSGIHARILLKACKARNKE